MISGVRLEIIEEFKKMCAKQGHPPRRRKTWEVFEQMWNEWKAGTALASISEKGRADFILRINSPEFSKVISEAKAREEKGFRQPHKTSSKPDLLRVTTPQELASELLAKQSAKEARLRSSSPPRSKR